MKKGFTIVELLMVIGIIIILMGVVTTAAAQSIRASRARRADALCALVQAGMNAYYARHDKWPDPIGSKVENGTIGSGGNQEGVDNSTDNDKYVLSGTEVRGCVQALVDETKKGSPVMDISGLYVSRSQGELSGNKVKKASGIDFMSAIRGTYEKNGNGERWKTASMYYGYPDPSTGYFLRFKMVYSIPTDQITVSKQR